MFKGLPEFCYAELPSTKEYIIIKRGEKGYYRVNELSDAYLCSVDRNNELIGVTKAQKEAMIAGSMWGWDVTASNPAMYDENGEFIKEKVDKTK